MVRIPVGVLLRDPHFEKVMCTHLQHVPLHRVHTPGLAGNDLEVLVVEEVDGVHEGRVPLDGPGRAELHLVGLVAEVEVHVETGVGDLDDGVAAALQPCGEHLRLVPGCAKARVAVHDIDVFVPARWRGASSDRAEERGVPLPTGEHEVGSRREEAGHHGENCGFRRARVAVTVRAEHHESVRPCLYPDAVLPGWEGFRLGAILGLQ
mmetsp:Transcript_114850/g.319885  ORF Transcript_114850/g.319885 Transcript_114850/m.319885 type:complete len:207 (-) Transcript_114850:449-1069(-)